MLEQVLASIHVPSHGRGRPRTRPDSVIADKTYSAGTIRRELGSRRITAVIREKSDTIAEWRSCSMTHVGRGGPVYA